MDELYLHNSAIGKYNDLLYRDIFTEDNLTSKKKCITIVGEKYYGYYMEKNMETYFIDAAYRDTLPFKILKWKEFDYKGDVIKFVTDATSIKIPAENRIPIRKLIDNLPSFSHSKPIHFLLFKILCLASFVDRLNARISTDAGFGKDSVVNIIGQLVDSTVNIYGATFAKLEYCLLNKLMVLNEMGNLKSEDKFNMQEFLLAVGAYFNVYTKRTRKGKGTQEQYDISKLSLLIFYNLPSYYVNKAQEYFDQIFTKAVSNRFIPFVFEGRLTTDFGKAIDVEKIVNENEQNYKDIIATINYYRANNVTTMKYELDKSLSFSDSLKRYERTFNTIAKYIGQYAKDKTEFDMLTKELYKCYKNYGTLTIKDITTKKDKKVKSEPLF